jgi:pyridoxine 5-phosphate synthase
MIRLSVNVNKVATVRNARGGTVPSPVDAAKVCVAAGVHGITVHPRADERHIRRTDVYDIAAFLGPYQPSVEYNIEGDPRPDLIEMVLDVRPQQCTLVPVRPGEITSQAGWSTETPKEALADTIASMKASGVRVSLFVEAELQAVRWAAGLGADRIELYTEPFARAYEQGESAARESFDRYVRAAERAHDLGLGVNAGHDLDLDNLTFFRRLPHLEEVSIGHALISRSIFVGLDRVVGEYLAVLSSQTS